MFPKLTQMLKCAALRGDRQLQGTVQGCHGALGKDADIPHTQPGITWTAQQHHQHPEGAAPAPHSPVSGRISRRPGPAEWGAHTKPRNTAGGTSSWPSTSVLPTAGAGRWVLLGQLRDRVPSGPEQVVSETPLTGQDSPPKDTLKATFLWRPLSGSTLCLSFGAVPPVIASAGDWTQEPASESFFEGAHRAWVPKGCALPSKSEQRRDTQVNASKRPCSAGSHRETVSHLPRQMPVVSAAAWPDLGIGLRKVFALYAF